MPPLPGIRVIRSKIDGYGVVATRAFEPGDLIAVVDGVVWRTEDNLDDKYSLLIDDGIFMDMVDQTRWINHSCEPNADVELAGDEESGYSASIVAIRPIAADEEVTYDYAFDVEVAEPCRCGVATCRQWIIDSEQLHLVRSRRIAAM